MKTRKIGFLLFFFCVAMVISLISCKKDSSSSGSLTSSEQTAQLQNSDAQDAIADKTEEDIDSKLDELQNNNYAVAAMKSSLGNPSDTVMITVDHPDSTTFPKVVTLKYYSYADSSANEPIIKNGTITVTISLADASHPRLVTRVLVFDDFAVTTDSTTFVLNGTRTVTRTQEAIKFNGLKSIRISVIDNIVADMNFAEVTTGETDTLKFTRIVNKVRTAISHFKNVTYTPLDLLDIHFRHLASSDTLTYEGTVTGINEKSEEYTKTITSKLIITDYKGSLIISAGTITYVVGTDSYQISFQEDPDHMHFTLVTVTNNLNGTTKSFDRRFSRLFKKWW